MTPRNPKTINLLADVMAPLALVAVTIAVFFLFMPEEPGTLFWTNMIYSGLLELLLFAYIIWIPKRGDSVAFKWMGGLYTVNYVWISVVWMLVFSLWLQNYWSLRVYFAVIAVLTVIWLVTSALSLKAENAHEISVEALSMNRNELTNVINSADIASQQFSLLVSSHPELKSSQTSINTLCRGLKTLSPTVMANPDASRRIRSICSGLEDILARPASELSATMLRNFAEQSLIILNSIKNSIRK